MLRNFLALIFLGFFLLIGASTLSRADGLGDSLGLSPYWNWKTIETEHFRVTFPADLARVAMKSANYLEEAHAFLSSALYWQPTYKTQVLVIDNSDAANGLTSPIMRLGMVFMVTPPDNWFSTAYYDDWLRLLAIHEYTHFLNMDITSGVYSVLRYAFGDVLLPNSIWPTWMLEGLAVYMETRFTRAGRGRSPYYDMILRSAVEAEVLNKKEFITLDKINGTDPYFPDGETPYLFGYEMMNRVASEPIKGISADGTSVLKSGEDALGDMSRRSSGRVPFFINWNLENITGKDWYNYWDEWIKDVRWRANNQLRHIKSQPVTPVAHITHGGSEVLGSAPSPDGQWLAYTRESSDRRMALYLRNNSTGGTRQVMDKLLGATMAFTPDSRRILFSALRRTSNYYLFSDLGIYDLESGSFSWLTDGLRARDPDVSRDGNWVVFTISETAVTGIGVAPLIKDDDELKLGRVERVYMPPIYGRAATPKFSADGKQIIFSLHLNGKASEDIVVYDRAEKKLSTLVSDGSFNRFPALNRTGDLFFVSDATGVDNLYKYLPGLLPQMVTNVTTGLAFPSFSTNDTAYVSAFSHNGWDLAQVKTNSSPIKPQLVTVDRHPAPKVPDSEESAPPVEKHYLVEDYSVFPSIWPRQWLPLLAMDENGTFIAGQVLGFDAVDRHRYVLSVGYDSQIKKPEWLAQYSNRSFGPTLSFFAANRTTTVSADTTSNFNFVREMEFSASIAFPIQWTYSTLTPSFSLNTERTERFMPGANPSDDDIVARSRYVPSGDLLLSFSDARTSKLSISPEEGRETVVGARLYNDSGLQTWKALVKDTEFFRITDHSVLVPAAKASWITHINPYYASANVVAQGRIDRIQSPFLSDDFEQLSIRGYPQETFYFQAAGVFSLDYRFPIFHVYRGSGTNPAFLEHVSGFVFGETLYYPGGTPAESTLPSAGLGITTAARIFIHVPVVLSLEYHRGFREEFGGRGELFFQLGLDAFQF